MKRSLLSATGSVLLLAASLVASAAPSFADPGHGRATGHSVRVCSDPAPGQAACQSYKMTDKTGKPLASSTPPPTALTPAGLQDAYKLTGLTSGGRTVAIVDAYGYPSLERDLGVFRSQFGLPACTKANGCLKIVNQTGGTSLPAFNSGWAGEQALDVDAVSSACPDCKIVVVQTKSASMTDLGTGVQTAAKMPGVVAISNSYGGGDSSDASYGKYYNFPGIAVTASAGDNGYQGGSYPASSSYVTAVGGTSLNKASNTRGWSESVWSGTGSGCSTVNAALPAQAGLNTGCSKRAMNDVAAVADPSNGGLAVYYPTTSTSSTWGQFGGTSEASPIIASVYALSGNTGSAGQYANALPYANPGALFDVTGGSNGTCPTTIWCNAGTGWDGPTGLGTPNGTAGF
ncbi:MULTISPECIES: S53 family peptidase [Arthrobacter]|uniref:S53 family peptidase n=2 Tax=Arthrobacter TaxID=1663 RepID=A0ABU9KP42_9MICC|nr:S53 family peptidase [Arthrobacter sp. YJM1]MDP5228700.1 S53 family peptidase [Arthrobacter sp. YJM1]